MASNSAETLQISQRTRPSRDEVNVLQPNTNYCNLLVSSRGHDSQRPTSNDYKQNEHQVNQQENMKQVHSLQTYSISQRTKSSEQTNAHCSTGGSTSFNNTQQNKRTQLRLNTNLVNQPSIPTPHSTSNSHSSRMLYYQQTQDPSYANSRPTMASTPKSSSSVIQIPVQNQQQSANYTSSLLISGKHRQQIQSQNNKNQSVLASDLQSFIPQTPTSQASDNSGIARVGNGVPKASTSSNNLKNFNNLRQFNQIVQQNRNQTQQDNQLSPKNSSSKTQQSSIDTQEASKTRNSNQILQNHSRHIQQAQSSKTQLHRPKGSLDISERTGAVPAQRLNPKNLQINIPQSPRVENTSQVQSETTGMTDSQVNKQGYQIHSGSMSTTNANQGNIKLNKFTCLSTRNNAQKVNIFNNKAKQADENNPNSENGEMSLQPAHKIIIPNHETTKHSLKRNGVVRAYAANTNQGLVRNYNEDRVSIILNILKPPNRQAEQWPRCSFFGIYDGHGGAACADFLRDNLHQFVIKEQSFPKDPKEALRNGFANAEKKFLELCQNEHGILDKSGSCAIVVLIVEDMCYVANVGDSRALLSAEQGNKIFPLSRDHKPNDEQERKRIIEGGGQIYQQDLYILYKQPFSRTAAANIDTQNPSKKEVIVGPLRVLPGRLSVSRTFGDAEAKLQKYGGNAKVVIAEPEIKSFKITKEHDFIILGCDGIFDKLSNQETIQCVWNSVKDNKQLGFAQNIHKQSGMGVEYILKNSLLRRTLDNVTVVMIAFSNFKHAVFGQSASSSRPQQEGQNKINSSQVSTDNSQIQTEKKKENIPPQKSGQETRSKLVVNSNQNCQVQGLKTTTNAQLQNNSANLKKSGNIQGNQGNHMHPSTCIGNSKQPRHFDFSNV